MVTHLKRLWTAWKRIAHLIGDFQARILLTLIYFVVVLPFGVVVRWGGDPLRIKRRPAMWVGRSSGPSNMEWARRQW
jgi:hypothetical protein